MNPGKYKAEMKLPASCIALDLIKEMTRPNPADRMSLEKI
jgi:hypothetical protein